MELPDKDTTVVVEVAVVEVADTGFRTKACRTANPWVTWELLPWRQVQCIHLRTMEEVFISPVLAAHLNGNPVKIT